MDLAVLAGNAWLHVRLGGTLVRNRAVALAAIVNGCLSNALTAVVVGRSLFLQAASHTHAIGLGNLTATLFTAAVFSCTLFALTWLPRRIRAATESRQSVAGIGWLVLHWAVVLATAAGLVYLEVLWSAR